MSSFASFARADESALLAGSGFWRQVHDLVVKCAVAPIQDKGFLVSVCSELVVSESSARFTLDGNEYSAALTDSENSDGGDLNDVTVRNARGKIVAVRRHVAAYGDVLLALAGGESDFRRSR